MAITTDQLLEVPWFPVVNDLIGGWAVATADKPCSGLDARAGEIEVASFIDEALARHISDLHNGLLGSFSQHVQQ